MCGIAGYFGRSTISEDSIARCLSLMRNRGPDANGHVVHSKGGQNVVLLHSRLSIIDLDDRANQPFTNGKTTLVYNGEIYNYLEVRAELEKCGYQFTTESDTEVLFHSWDKWAGHSVEHLEGMWAFAIYDHEKGLLTLSRDRFAEKPLYLYKTTHGIYFASEIKFIQALLEAKLEIQHKQLLRYLVYGYKSLYKTKDCFFKGIKEVSYATNVTIDSNLDCVESTYWQPQYTPQNMSLADAIEGSREHLINSMKLRLRADVPVAFCLSGGIDSATLASIAAKECGRTVHSYSIIDPDERYNEYDLIKATVDDIGCRPNYLEISKENSLERLAKLITYHDGPIATITYYVHSFLSEAIAADGYKVVFSGTAADELFTGYYDHYLLHLFETKNHADYGSFLNAWQQHILPVIRNPHLQNHNLYVEDPDFREHLWLNSDRFREFLLQDYSEEFEEHIFSSSLLRSRMLNEIFYEATRVILHEDDLNSMMNSIENRSPYLDSRLFEFAYSIPPEHLIHDGYAKYVLREAASGILNDSVRLTRQKKGFNASVQSVFDLESDELRDFLLEDSPIFEIINRADIADIVKAESLPNSYSKFLFNVINAKLFLEHFS